MSKNIAISEGENARVFGNAKKLKTQLQGEDAGSCFWVPENETQANPVYIMENGLHTAAEAGEYGFSVAHVNVPTTVTDLNGNDWKMSIDEIGIPHIEISDIDIGDIDISIDDVTGEMEITIGDEEFSIDPEDFDFNPDADIDISLDPDNMNVDLVGTDLDGIDSLVEVDPATGDFEKESCPKSIYILSRPVSLVYTEGEPLNFAGLAIAALDADGMDWPDPEHFTPITFSEISTPTTKASTEGATGEFATINGDIPVYSVSTGYFTGGSVYIFGRLCYWYLEIWAGSSGPVSGGSIYVNKDSNGNYSYNSSVPNTGIRAVARYADTGGFAAWNPPGVVESIPAPESSKPIADEDINSVEATEYTVPVTVQWISPCYETLEATFDITVYPNKDSGSHHGGKF